MSEHMIRRHFIQAGAALAATSLQWPVIAAQPAQPLQPSRAPALKRLGDSEPFDYARLKGRARALAGTAYAAPSQELPPAIAKLSWDQWQAIRFRDDHSLWGGE